MIRVAVAGAAGRMGLAVCAAVEGAEDMRAHRPCRSAARHDARRGAAATPTCVVDFTQPETALENALACVRAGVHAVIGTTGFDLGELERRVPSGGGRAGANVLVAPNFAIGAVLMMRFAAEAARHMAKAEIVELHHDRKLDAPSGTAALTARADGRRERRRPAPPIHSVRLPGLVAHQEVILGDLGQTLTIRHDSIDRESFMPGVLLAVRRIAALAAQPLDASGLREPVSFGDARGDVG